MALVAALVSMMTTAATAPAAAADDDYFLVKWAYSDAIYKVPGTPEEWAETGAPRTHVSPDEWLALGSPQPVLWPTDTYAALPWSARIYAEIHWPDHPGVPSTHHLTLQQWEAEGRPAPARDILLCQRVGCLILRYATAPHLYVIEGGSYAYESVGEPWHQLTYAEWETLGFPYPFHYFQPLGAYKLPWADTIFLLYPTQIGPAGHSTSNTFGETCAAGLTPAEWVHLGSPAPVTVTSTTSDRFVMGGQPGWLPPEAIVYDGPAGYIHLTEAQWAAAGRPVPDVVPAPLLPVPAGGCWD